MDVRARAPAKVALVLVALFFLSGMAGLIYQVVWLRMLIRAFGVTVHAVTTVLAVFMAGLALGSFAAARIGRGRTSLRQYAVIELLIGVTSAGSTFVILALPEMFREAVRAIGPASAAVVPLVRIVSAVLVLLPPTILMGATLPIAGGYLAASGRELGRRAGALYGANTVGAVVGVVASGFALIATIGELATVGVAVATNVIVGVAGLVLARRARSPLTRARGELDTAPASAPAASGSGASRRILIVALVSGACALSLEVIWARICGVLLGNSVYGYASMLGAYLTGIGLGSALMARFVDRLRSPMGTFAGLEIGNALVGVASLHVIILVGSGERGPWYAYATIWELGDFGRLAGYSMAIVLPVTLIYGAIFPVVCRLVAGGRDGPARALGRLVGYNTVGGIIGSTVTGFILIPSLGTRWSFVLVSVVSLGIGFYLLWLATLSERLRGGPWFAVAAAAGMLGLIASTDDPFLRLLRERVSVDTPDLVAHVEDRGATISVFESRERDQRTLYINGLYVSNRYPGVGELMVNLPLAFHPADGPKRVLVVGLGVGEALRYGIDVGHEMTVVELHSSVVDLFRSSDEQAARVLDSPRSRIVVDDGRNFLLRTDATYDLVFVDGSPPVYASGMVNLYSLEFVRLARQHLTEHGLLAIWFPVVCFEADFWMVLRNVAETFDGLQVFSPPRASNALIVGAVGAAAAWPIDVAEFERRVARWHVDPRASAETFLRGLRLDPHELAAQAARYPLLTDDKPTTEFPLWRFVRGEPYFRDNRFLYDADRPEGPASRAGP